MKALVCATLLFPEKWSYLIEALIFGVCWFIYHNRQLRNSKTINWQKIRRVKENEIKKNIYK